MEQKYKLKSGTGLLGSDMQGSVLFHRQLSDGLRLSYAPYGDLPTGVATPHNLGFNAQLREHIGYYLLGNGYRAFSPRLMRFLSADHLSPFGAGGFNSYMYCSGDPINNIDPSGHIKRPLANLLDPIGIHNGNLYKSIIEDGKRMLNLNRPVELKEDYKAAITKGIEESNVLVEKLTRYNKKEQVQQYLAHEKAAAAAQKIMERYTGSDRGEKAHFKRASEDQTMARSKMTFLRTQYRFIGDWLELRTNLPDIQNDIKKANQVLRSGQ
ncbi:RHS repeat-associated core domain-containing protein [Pseudomonas putida]|nr:RHS repeat-associated core domain-containing protein [Pseudomonas putida]